MSKPNIYVRVHNRKDTDSSWSELNPVLLDGEVIIVSLRENIIRFKVGDGITHYNNLPFLYSDIISDLDKLSKEFSNIKDSVDEKLSELDTSLTQKVSDLEETVNNDLTKKITELENSVNEDIDILAESVVNSINNLESDTNNKLDAMEESTNIKISDIRDSVYSNLSTMESNINSKFDATTSKDNIGKILTVDSNGRITFTNLDTSGQNVTISSVIGLTELLQSKAPNDKVDELMSSMDELMREMDELKYVAIAITSFTSSISTVELGQTVNDVTLSWKLNKTAKSVLLDNVPQTAGINSITLRNQGITSNKSWVLKVIDEKDATATKSTGIQFLNGVYYGALSKPSAYNSSFILGLSRELSNTRGRTINVDAKTGQHIYYCVPSRLGSCKFNVGGFDGGFSKVSTISFTNSSKYTESYDIYESTNAGLGSISVKIS